MNVIDEFTNRINFITDTINSRLFERLTALSNSLYGGEPKPDVCNVNTKTLDGAIDELGMAVDRCMTQIDRFEVEKASEKTDRN